MTIEQIIERLENLKKWNANIFDREITKCGDHIAGIVVLDENNTTLPDWD